MILEFIKKNRREVLITLGWMLVSVVYFYSMLLFILNNNLFSWGFNFDLITYTSLFVNTITLILMLILAKKTTGVISQVISLIIALLFALLAVISVLPDNDSILRSVESPWVFRVTLSIFYITPLLVWIAIPFQYVRTQRKTNKS